MTKFKGSLGDYEIRFTDDGSKTVYSSFFDENCHSTNGAYAETLLHYVKGCEIRLQESPKILEIGFATGLGYQCTKDCLKDTPFVFHSLEIDEGLVEHTIKTTRSRLVSKLKKNGNHFYAKENEQELRVYIGDARTTIKSLNNSYYSAIYQDPFSPKKNSALWTWQWFEELKRVASVNCIMSTYSASKSIRKAMIKSGWKLSRGKSFGAKKDSTIARLLGETDSEITRLLERSLTPPLSD